MVISNKTTKLRPTKLTKGFSLVELLVVIAIIGILSTVIVTGIRESKNRAERAVATENAKQLETSLALFELDNGYYPGIVGEIETSENNSTTGWNPTGSLSTRLVPKYISQLPVSPNVTYTYIPAGDPNSNPSAASVAVTFTGTLSGGGGGGGGTPTDDEVIDNSSDDEIVIGGEVDNSCQLTSAVWSEETVTVDSLVYLTVTGTNCDDDSLNFQIREDDLLLDDPVNLNPISATFIDGIAISSWTTEHQWDYFTTPEYYFTATLNSDETISLISSAPLLSVSSTTLPPQCSDRVDNDNDGLIDYPADPDCATAVADDEATAVVEEEPVDDLVAHGDNEECFDSLDNDNDGQIDFADFGCAGPNGQETDTDYGWTVFTPSADTKIIYVSYSLGNNSWSGLLPEPNEAGTDGPIKTPDYGYNLIRNGYPDWLLLRRGDSWPDAQLAPDWYSTWRNKSGRSNTEPIVVSSYGESSQRPQLKTIKSSLIWNNANLSFVGLELYAEKKDPTSPNFLSSTGASGGFSLLYTNENILLEDNLIRFAGSAIQGNWDNVKLRRNIIANAYSTNSHAQGLYTSGAGYLLIEDNIFYHNGWNDDFRFEVTPTTLDPTIWAGVSDGYFQITLQNTAAVRNGTLIKDGPGQTFAVRGVDFRGVSTMAGVAQVLENAINQAIGIPNAISFDWTGAVFVLRSQTFVSSAVYSISTLADQASTDLSVANWLNGASIKIPESTIFNRNMYLSAGYGNTIVRGNIDASGASGGVQLRMGGLIEDNLYLRDPISISLGHTQNPAETTIGGTIRRNVILGGRNIDTQPQGGGINISSSNTTDYGHNYIDGVYVYDNIIAHNKLGTGNVVGIIFSFADGSKNLAVHDNLIYDWRQAKDHATDHRGTGLVIGGLSGFVNAKVYNNTIIQPNKGFIIGTSLTNATKVELYDNKYYSTSGDPGAWSSSWFGVGNSVVYSFLQWVALTNDNSQKLTAIPNYLDPERDIEDYAASLGLAPTYEAFMTEAMKQSRFNWRPEYTAYAVNEYIREGFQLVE